MCFPEHLYGGRIARRAALVPAFEVYTNYNTTVLCRTSPQHRGVGALGYCMQCMEHVQCTRAAPFYQHIFKPLLFCAYYMLKYTFEARPARTPGTTFFEIISSQYRRVDVRKITPVVQLEWPSHLIPPPSSPSFFYSLSLTPRKRRNSSKPSPGWR